MLNESELRNLISMEKEKLQYVVDFDARKQHRAFILGLECVLNE